MKNQDLSKEVTSYMTTRNWEELGKGRWAKSKVTRMMQDHTHTVGNGLWEVREK